MPLNYVKFMRGTPEAFAALPIEQRRDDTLYFIAGPLDATGELWLGNTLIASGAPEGVAATKLSELLDVDVKNVQNGQYLGYDLNQSKWVPLDLLITINKVSGLQEALDNKVNKTYYSVPAYDAEGNPVLDDNGEQVYNKVEGTLLSPTDQNKLDSLVITEGGVEISGTVNAANVQGLNEWITANRNVVPGLHPSELETNVKKAIKDLNELTEVVKTHTTDITSANSRIDDIINNLNNYVSLVDYNNKITIIENDIDTLKSTLTWKSI